MKDKADMMIDEKTKAIREIKTVQENARTIDQASDAALLIDYTLYEKYFEESDMSDEQKTEFLDTLWSIIVGFVDLGFGVHPLQQADEACGQEIDLTSLMATDVIASSKGLPQKEFKQAAKRIDNPDAGRKES